MRIDSESLQGTTIPIEGLRFKYRRDLIDYINKIYKEYPGLTSKQWRTILFILSDALAIGFENERKDSE